MRDFINGSFVQNWTEKVFSVLMHVINYDLQNLTFVMRRNFETTKQMRLELNIVGKCIAFDLNISNQRNYFKIFIRLASNRDAYIIR